MQNSHSAQQSLGTMLFNSKQLPFSLVVFKMFAVTSYKENLVFCCCKWKECSTVFQCLTLRWKKRREKNVFRPCLLYETIFHWSVLPLKSCSWRQQHIRCPSVHGEQRLTLVFRDDRNIFWHIDTAKSNNLKSTDLLQTFIKKYIYECVFDNKLWI